MKAFAALGIMYLALAAHVGQACSLDTGMQPFAAGMDALPKAAGHDDELEAPELEVTGLTRGIGGRIGSCDDTGLLSIRLNWPRGDYKIEDIGFEFKVVSSDEAYPIFPATPIAVTSGKRRADLLFMWDDDVPAQQKPVYMEVEVRAVTHGNVLGPPARLVIDSRVSG